MSKVKDFLSTKPERMTAGQSLVYTALITAVGLTPVIIVVAWYDIRDSIERRKLKKVQKAITKPLSEPISKEEEAE